MSYTQYLMSNLTVFQPLINPLWTITHLWSSNLNPLSLFAQVSHLKRTGQHGTFSSMDGTGEVRSIHSLTPALMIVILGALN